MRRGRAGERGATLVEAAILLPVFFLLVFGMLEFGFAFKEYLTLANGTRDGARTASTAGNQANADYLILQAVEEATSAANSGALQRVVIFKATGPEDSAPSTCRDGTPQTGADACNVYGPADFALTEAQFDCAGAGTAPDSSWCPTTRKTAAVAPNGPPDYIGVWIEVEYSFITGLFPQDTLTMTDETIMRIEPRTVE